MMLDPEADLTMTGNGSSKSSLYGVIHPFRKSHTTVFGQVQEEVKALWRRKDVRLAAILVLLNFCVTAVLASWSSSTNSLALRGHYYITIFELLCLLTYIVSVWVMCQDRKSNSRSCYMLGYQRIEVLAVFATVVTVQLSCIFLIKECIERMMEQPEIHAGRLLPGAFLAIIFHVVSNYLIVNHALMNICEVASSSWMQEHVADVSKGLCGFVPVLETFLLPRMNPFFLVSISAGCGVFLVDVLLQVGSYYTADTLVGLCIALITIGTMWPIATCSGRVLLHTTPSQALGQLDKLLSEVQTLDGVLEIKSKKFYTLSMGMSGNFGNPLLRLAGSLEVRLRRDADEQLVLAHVTNRLSPLVPLLTVQVLKDGWASSSGIAPISVKLPVQSSPILGFSKTSYISGFNKPAAAVAPYLQTPSRIPTNPASNALISPGSKTEAQSPQAKNDFSFTSPSRIAPSQSFPKPRHSFVDIGKVYNSALLQSDISKSGHFNMHGRTSLGLKMTPSSFLNFKGPGVLSPPSLAKPSINESFQKP